MRAVDLFAGLGGNTEGAKGAGVRVVWAGNHWRIAVDTHAMNHPETTHACQDLHQADWSRVPSHDLLLASPACQGHSQARGKDRPHHDAARSTAWAVVSCAEYHRPEFVIVENVKDFRKWTLFPAWQQAMHALGYSMSLNLLDAADYGVPQNRLRLFIVCTRSRHPLQLADRRGSHAPIAPYLDLAGGTWRKIDGGRKPLAPDTLERIANGRRVYGDRFLISYYGNTKCGRSIDRPVGTITTKDRWAIIDGDRMRMFNVDECKAAMGFRPSYKLPEQSQVAKHMLGNAVCPPQITEIIREIAA